MWRLEEQECGENSDPKMNESKLSTSWFTHQFSETLESNFLFLMYLGVVSKPGSCCSSLWDAGTPGVYQYVWQIRLPLVYFFFNARNWTEEFLYCTRHTTELHLQSILSQISKNRVKYSSMYLTSQSCSRYLHREHPLELHLKVVQQINLNYQVRCWY